MWMVAALSLVDAVNAASNWHCQVPRDSGHTALCVGHGWTCQAGQPGWPPRCDRLQPGGQWGAWPRGRTGQGREFVSKMPTVSDYLWCDFMVIQEEALASETTYAHGCGLSCP